jgi:hypothetical protein
MDHGGCTETREGDFALHDCGACEHGARRGGSYQVGRGDRIDAMQRRLKLHAIDGLSCDHPSHAAALAGDGPWEGAEG